MTAGDLLDDIKKHPEYKIRFVASLGPDEISAPCDFRFEGYTYGVNHVDKAIVVLAIEL